MNDVGYGRPPTATRFRKGQSGNPKGRPKGRKAQAPYEAILGRTVPITENGAKRRVEAAEAFFLAMRDRGFSGHEAAAQVTLSGLQSALQVREAQSVGTIVITPVKPGSLNSALEKLRIATKLDRSCASARMMLEPWIVTKALERLEPGSLTEDEQATVLRSVRTPHKVSWPDWWTVRGARSSLG